MQAITWDAIEPEQLNDKIRRQTLHGALGTYARLSIVRGGFVPRHSHMNEQLCTVHSGALRFIFDDREVIVRAGEMLLIPPDVPHAAEAIEDTWVVDIFSPRREDWLRKEDHYLRGANG
jgi:quercetin dioxygenase-like cupin family protein